MKEVRVKFSSVENVERFSAKANQCNFDIDVCYNHIFLDGKSIVALLSLDLSKAVIIRYEGENQQLEDFISGLELPSEKEVLSNAFLGEQEALENQITA